MDSVGGATRGDCGNPNSAFGPATDVNGATNGNPNGAGPAFGAGCATTGNPNGVAAALRPGSAGGAIVSNAFAP